MAKQDSHEFAHEDDALIILPKKKGAGDALVFLPGEEGAEDTLVILPEEGSTDEPLLLLPESEEAEAAPLEEAPETLEAQERNAKMVKLPDEKKARHDIKERAMNTAWKKRKSPSMPKLGMETLTKLPANIAMVQGFLKAINWKEAQAEVLEGLSNTIVIVGQPNTGKSTLFNHLKGQHISEVSPQAGTTKSLIRTDFGPFTLVDTPGHLPDITEVGISEASLVVFMVDGEKGLRPDDRNLLMTIKKLEKPTIVTVNKIDMLTNALAGDEMANDVAMRLGIPGVIPISARLGTNVADELVPAMIAASPEAALVIGRELPAYRRDAAQRLIRNATLVSLAAGLEPIPLIDIPILIGTQIRLVLHLAALYGEHIDSADTVKHARELLLTMVSGLGMRYLAEQVAKAIPFGGDLIAGAIAGAATWSIGEVALEYYEGGKRFDASRIRSLTGGFYQRFRKGNQLEELRQQSLTGQDRPLSIESEEKR